MHTDIGSRLGTAILSPAPMGSAGIVNSGTKWLIMYILVRPETVWSQLSYYCDITAQNSKFWQCAYRKWMIFCQERVRTQPSTCFCPVSSAPLQQTWCRCYVGECELCTHSACHVYTFMRFIITRTLSCSSVGYRIIIWVYGIMVTGYVNELMLMLI